MKGCGAQSEALCERSTKKASAPSHADDLDQTVLRKTELRSTNSWYNILDMLQVAFSWRLPVADSNFCYTTLDESVIEVTEEPIIIWWFLSDNITSFPCNSLGLRFWVGREIRAKASAVGPDQRKAIFVEEADFASDCTSRQDHAVVEDEDPSPHFPDWSCSPLLNLFVSSWP